MDSHETWMRMALEEARKAFELGEVPVGAVLVRGDEPIAREHNRTNELGRPRAHAESLAIEEGARVFGDWRLEGTTLYSTLEPCLMCAGMVVLARVPEVVYGARDTRFGAFGSVTDVRGMPNLNHYPGVLGGVLARESRELLREFFRSRRNGAYS